MPCRGFGMLCQHGCTYDCIYRVAHQPVHGHLCEWCVREPIFGAACIVSTMQHCLLFQRVLLLKCAGLSNRPLRLQAFVEAVHAGDIFWHAMPFNTQVEMFDAPLLQYAVELTHELDAKFGQKPKRAMSQVRYWHPDYSQRCHTL